MGRLLFFFQEALRALKRNGAPSLAAIVTTVVTVVLLGMLIPIFQTAQGKSDEVRDQLNVQYALYDDATKAEIASLQKELEGIPHVAEVTFIGKDEALATLKSELKDKTIVEELHTNPLPNSFEVKADDAAYLDSVQRAVYPNGPKGKSISPIISTASVSGSFSKCSRMSRNDEPLIGPPPMPTEVDTPMPSALSYEAAS